MSEKTRQALESRIEELKTMSTMFLKDEYGFAGYKKRFDIIDCLLEKEYGQDWSEEIDVNVKELSQYTPVIKIETTNKKEKEIMSKKRPQKRNTKQTKNDSMIPDKTDFNRNMNVTQENLKKPIVEWHIEASEPVLLDAAYIEGLKEEKAPEKKETKIDQLITKYAKDKKTVQQAKIEKEKKQNVDKINNLVAKMEKENDQDGKVLEKLVEEEKKLLEKHPNVNTVEQAKIEEVYEKIENETAAKKPKKARVKKPAKTRQANMKKALTELSEKPVKKTAKTPPAKQNLKKSTIRPKSLVKFQVVNSLQNAFNRLTFESKTFQEIDKELATKYGENWLNTPNLNLHAIKNKLDMDDVIAQSELRQDIETIINEFQSTEENILRKKYAVPKVNIMKSKIGMLLFILNTDFEQSVVERYLSVNAIRC